MSTNFDAGNSNLASELRETAGNPVFCNFLNKITPTWKNKASKKGQTCEANIEKAIADADQLAKEIAKHDEDRARFVSSIK